MISWKSACEQEVGGTDQQEGGHLNRGRGLLISQKWAGEQGGRGR